MQASLQTFYFSVVNYFDDGKSQELHTVTTCCEDFAVGVLADDLRLKWEAKPNWRATIINVTELEFHAIRTRLRQDLESQREKQAEQALLN